ncbi:hypothetical protein BDY21DRAFT_209455 [Lineolata rhizophorae]|uniref:Uncharacterized protein n=1 Tax=Lineolata rhizophorae TaxID=578093 RepID=A0A6A6P4H2_9PEZI|nr:hypothetical protein BDY21DRAFT_209455 [Lineolata rhizophorae]
MAPYVPLDGPASPKQIAADYGNALLLFLRSRRGRTMAAAGTLILVLLCLANTGRQGSFSSTGFAKLWSADFFPSASVTDPPVLTPTNVTLGLGNSTTVPSGLSKGNPSFHLLVPVQEGNENFCKTILSSFLLNFPPPTLLNWNQTFDNPRISQIAKLGGVVDYLSDPRKVSDDDLVLIVDAYDVRFQLPADVFIRRYHSMLRDANAKLVEDYGVVPPPQPSRSGPPAESPLVSESAVPQPAFSQSIVFGANKNCYPNHQDELACAAVPDSPLPTDVYGDRTDLGVSGAFRRAKYLDAGTIMGPVRDLRELYRAALNRAQSDPKLEEAGAQHVLSTLYGEQEAARSFYLDELKVESSWFSRLWRAMYPPPITVLANSGFNATDGIRHEFSIGLDYTSNLFMTTSPQASRSNIAELTFPRFNDADLLAQIGNSTPHPAGPLTLPPALLGAELPFALRPQPFPDVGALPTGHPQSDRSSSARDATPPASAPDSLIETLQFDAELDALPSPGTTWSEVPLGVNPYLPAVPAVLHLGAAFYQTLGGPDDGSGPPSRLQRAGGDLWPQMWFAPHARALLRRYLRTPQGPLAAHDAAVGGESWWDMRGGKGGVWTDRGEWLAWNEVCDGCEDAVFADRWGKWGEERTMTITEGFEDENVDQEEESNENNGR